MNNKYDFIIFGASGFTGKLVVEYVLKTYGFNSGINWAIAGRNKQKLLSIKADLDAPNDLEIFIVDSNDKISIDAMINKTKCVLTTVGPYQLYGSNIVEACVNAGVDYVDLCGEPGWMYEMIANHEEAAIKSGSRIIFSCGFDSIPFDLGVHFIQKETKKVYGKAASSVRGRVMVMDGEFSGGTAASLKATMKSLKHKPELFEVLANPLSLSKIKDVTPQPQDSKPFYDEKLQSWVAPFFMAPINTKNVHRSNSLLNFPYGKDFKYNEMWASGPGDEGEKLSKLIASTNPLMGDNIPKPGEGPSKESREKGSYDIHFYADINDEFLSASVSGDMDPGYGSTSKMIAESAICIVKECNELVGGIYTPSSSMGDKLIVRLEKNAGLKFKLLN